MGLGLLLVPALAGYLFLNWFNATRYSLPRETGYHVVFQSAIAGVLLFFIARLFVVLANTLIPAIAEFWNNYRPPRLFRDRRRHLHPRGTPTIDPQQVLQIRPVRGAAKSRRGGWRSDQPHHRSSNAARSFRRTLSDQRQVLCRLTDSRYVWSSRRRRCRLNPDCERLPRQRDTRSRHDHELRARHQQPTDQPRIGRPQSRFPNARRYFRPAVRPGTLCVIPGRPGRLFLTRAHMVLRIRELAEIPCASPLRRMWLYDACLLFGAEH